MVPVPSLETVLANHVPEKEQETFGTYGLVASQERVEQSPHGESSLTAVICPNCSARLHPELKKTASQTTCPDCLEVIDVPAKSSRRRKKKRKRPDPGNYAITHPESEAARPKTMETGYLEAQAEIRSEPPPPIPTWTFFTGVFDFPLRQGGFVRWGLMSLGFTAIGGISAIILTLWAMGAVMAIPFFALPMIWVSIMTISYAAACWSTVVEGTAAGNDVITDWMEPNWREWFAKLIYVSFVTAVASLVPWLIAIPVAPFAGAMGFWGVFGGMLFLVWPVVMMSSLEADSPWVPITRPILVSLRKLWWGWLMYYGISVGLVAAYLVPLILGVKFWMPVVTLLLTGPLLATVVMIQARVFGRLAWRGVVMQEPEPTTEAE